MSKNDQPYFEQRAAEELAAAERASCAAAEEAHRELSLRYALKLILPEPSRTLDDSQPIGRPKPVSERPVPLPPRRPSAKRRRA